MAQKNTNPEALVQAHLSLWASLAALDAAAGANKDGLADLRQQLSTTQLQVRDHFRFEEANGYLDPVRQREPRLENGIRRLLQEHRQLEQALAALLEETGRQIQFTPELQKRIKEWTRQVREHERRETDLVQDAFNVDMGTED